MSVAIQHKNSSNPAAEDRCWDLWKVWTDRSGEFGLIRKWLVVTSRCCSTQVPHGTLIHVKETGRKLHCFKPAPRSHARTVHMMQESCRDHTSFRFCRTYTFKQYRIAAGGFRSRGLIPWNFPWIIINGMVQKPVFSQHLRSRGLLFINRLSAPVLASDQDSSADKSTLVWHGTARVVRGKKTNA